MRNSIVLGVLLAITGLAQQDRATFTGTVTDPTGAAVPAATVKVQNTQTNFSYATKTNEAGIYAVPNLPIGSYRITFEAPGFKRFVRENLMVNIAQVVRVDPQLQVGASTESIEVKAEAPLLQAGTPEVGAVIGARQVIDLPLSFSGGRHAEDFAYKLTPGVGGDNLNSHING